MWLLDAGLWLGIPENVMDWNNVEYYRFFRLGLCFDVSDVFHFCEEYLPCHNNTCLLMHGLPFEPGSGHFSWFLVCISSIVQLGPTVHRKYWNSEQALETQKWLVGHSETRQWQIPGLPRTGSIPENRIMRHAGVVSRPCPSGEFIMSRPKTQHQSKLHWRAASPWFIAIYYEPHNQTVGSWSQTWRDEQLLRLDNLSLVKSISVQLRLSLETRFWCQNIVF